ncbi:MAG TPA: GNAT family N-acetyltransferase [Anaerolineaceae bacterium]|nr:GNAT family N-acetyltransferase [Anaerolineaceae bacterium]
MKAMLRPLLNEDRSDLERMLSRIKEFDQDDQSLALELIDTNLQNPDQKDYVFILACDEQDRPMGFACYGPTPLTDRTFDLYWIAVAPEYAGQGLGSRILSEVEARIVETKGRMLVIETSSSPIYHLSRQFYIKYGYTLSETLKDFYMDGEDRVTYMKKFPSA